MNFMTIVQSLNLGNDPYEIISFEESLKLNRCIHATHCGIYSLNSHMIEHEVGRYPTKAAIMVLFRSDGTLGFPGGFVDSDYDITQGLKREIKLKINLDIDKMNLPDPTYIVTYKYSFGTIKRCCHFYKLKVSIDVFRNIEKGVLDSPNYGHEIFGVLRVPLYTMRDGRNGLGLPDFLCNNFIANARDQLLVLIAAIEVMTVEEILESVKTFKQIISGR